MLSKLTAEQIEMVHGLLDGGKPPREVAKAFGVGRTTLYRSLQGTGEVAEAE
jgi:DNA invertase Pin-like site-specific DNA recombinase